MQLNMDQTLVDVVISGTAKGLSMTGTEPIPIGVSRLTTARHGISVIVGLVGTHSGNVSINISEPGMFYLASQMLGEDQKGLSEENIDAIMEVGNMVAGCVKESLMGSQYNISEISLPSLIFGQSYNVLYARGITTVSVEFEMPGLAVNAMNDRFFSTSISLLRGSGRRK